MTQMTQMMTVPIGRETESRMVAGTTSPSTRNRDRCTDHLRHLRNLRMLLVLLLAAPVSAHERTVSYSTWELAPPGVRVTARLSALDASRLPWMRAGGVPVEERLGAYLADRLVARAGGERCAVTRVPRRRNSSPDRLVFTWELTCPSTEGLALYSTVLREEAPSHLHLARVRYPDGAGFEQLLTEAAPEWLLPEPGAAHGTGSLAAAVLLGVEHILTGYDHLVFLLALVLLGGRIGDVVRIVTGFTIAHSITLALAVLGIARPPGGAIEALIGLSIALVAAENLWLAAGRPAALRAALAVALLALAGVAALGHGAVPALTLLGLALFTACYFDLLARVPRPAPLRAAVAFVFGLVHGFGFAGVLLEAELPRERLAATLFGFNVGVELGQVACVLLAWPVLQWALRARGGRFQRPIVEYASAIVLAVGVYWFTARTYG